MKIPENRPDYEEISCKHGYYPYCPSCEHGYEYQAEWMQEDQCELKNTTDKRNTPRSTGAPGRESLVKIQPTKGT